MKSRRKKSSKKNNNKKMQFPFMHHYFGLLKEKRAIDTPYEFHKLPAGVLAQIEEHQKNTKIYQAACSKSDYHPKFLRPHGFENGNMNFNAFLSDQAIITRQSNTGDIFAPRATEQNISTERMASKFRVVISKVVFFDRSSTKNATDKKNYTVKTVITANAPNLMGTSGKANARYLSSGKFNAKHYQQDCETIANLILHAAKENELKTISIANFGLGVYIKKLEKNDRIKAQKIMQSAFAAAAEKFKVTVKWVIYDNGSRYSNKLVNKINQAYSKNTHFNAIKGDIFKEDNIVNNGSDRTIGGKCIDNNTPSTTEEPLAHQSSLIMTQTTTFNPTLAAFKPIIVGDTVKKDKKKNENKKASKKNKSTSDTPKNISSGNTPKKPAEKKSNADSSGLFSKSKKGQTSTSSIGTSTIATKSNNLLEIDTIKRALPKWQFDLDKSKQFYTATHDKHDPFEVHAENFKSNYSNIETYKAMLKAYQATNPTHYPDVTINDDSDIAVWQKAFVDVYKVDKSNLTIHVDKKVLALK